MEAYKQIYDRLLNELDLNEKELLDVIERKDATYSQYEGLLDDINVCSREKARITDEQENIKERKLNQLRVVELLCIVLLFVCSLVLLGDKAILFEDLVGKVFGILLKAVGALSLSIFGTVMIIKLDKFLCSSIIKKLESKREYKYMMSESMKYSKIIEFKTKEKDKKLSEYTKLVDEENGLRKKIADGKSLQGLLESLIGEDREMDNIMFHDKKLVKKKVKKYKRLQIIVENDALNEGFGVLQIVKTFTIGNYAKK